MIEWLVFGGIGLFLVFVVAMMIYALILQRKGLKIEANELLRQNNALLRELLQDRQREHDEARTRHPA